MGVNVDLSGHRILVVEDDYYLATDTARALSGAGGVVVGPYPTEGAAQADVEEAELSAAVVDINLGAGASFKLAATLRKRAVPFVFVTGYDDEVIPAKFRDISRLQKPVDFRQVVDAIGKIVGARARP